MKPPKKLSTAMRRGYKIMKEKGIKQVRHTMFRVNGDKEIIGACALGCTHIGYAGKLVRGYKSPPIVFHITQSIVNMNDYQRKRIPTIIKWLEEQGL